MPKVPPTIEAQYIDCPDEEILRLVGRYHEELTRLKEAKKTDPDIGKLKHEIKEIELARHDGPIRRKEVHLAAVRAIAKLRGINYE